MQHGHSVVYSAIDPSLYSVCNLWATIEIKEVVVLVVVLVLLVVMQCLSAESLGCMLRNFSLSNL